MVQGLKAALRHFFELATQSISVEVIDARSLVPFNYEPVLASLRKTGRLLIVSEACERGSFAMTLAANITRFSFGDLKAPPRVLGAPNWIVPGAEIKWKTAALRAYRLSITRLWIERPK